jgi:uncharacterized protein YfaP (DUF2135 family)
MHPVVRSLAAAALAAVSLSCADDSVGIRRGSRLVSLPVAPVFATSATGGPRIEIETIKGVLRRANSTDSSMAEAGVRGDSAVLEFEDVAVTGEETTYELSVKAFDANGVLVFKGTLEVTLTPGSNTPAAPVLTYTAPDATASSIEVRAGGAPTNLVDLQWAGATPGSTTCLNRVPNASAKTQEQLSVVGTNDASQIVPDVRVGWVSRDTSVATVDENGVVRARCSNRWTYIVARTFLDVVDSIKINVTAPPFTLLMTPETANVPRGSQRQMTAILVDENNNATGASAVTWHSSDTERATVSSTGLVTGISNGRVVITASSGDRSTVGIIQVVPPPANRVELSVTSDIIAQGQTRIYGVVAFDSNGDRIPDASGFTWRSTNTGIVSVSSSGTVRGISAGTASVIVSLDGAADTATITVTASTTGRVAGRVVDAATGAAIAGATVTGGGASVQTGADGRFVSPEFPPNGSSITVSATGYASFSYFNLPIQLGQTVDLGDLPAAPAGGSGTMTGTVFNALNDAPVANATVRLFAGINSSASDPNSGVTTPGAVATTTTTANGTFTLASVPAGTYTYTVTGTGFSYTRVVAVAIAATTRDTRINLSPTVSGNGLRIVLTWGDCVANPAVPCDLDSHLTGPTSPPDASGRFYVAYFNPFYYNSPDTVAVLDNDAMDGLGPETITLRQKAAGAYKYYVHNFTDGADTTSTRLSTSAQARVNVYQGANLIATFLPPSGEEGTVWAVFQVEGTTITPVNQMLKMEDFNELPADFMRVGGGDDADVVRQVLSHLQRKKSRK